MPTEPRKSPWDPWPARHVRGCWAAVAAAAVLLGAPARAGAADAPVASPAEAPPLPGRNVRAAAATRSFLNVLDHGAACDGSTDDTGAFRAILGVVGDAHTTLRISGRCRVLGALTFPGSVALEFGGNGSLDAGATGIIRIDGTILAADQQIFYGTAGIQLKFARTVTGTFDARWWGAGLNSDDDGPRLQRAIDAIRGYSKGETFSRTPRLRIPAGSYSVRTPVVVEVAQNDLGLVIEGDGWKATYVACQLQTRGDCFTFRRPGPAVWRDLEIRNLWIQGNSNARYLVNVAMLRRGRFENLLLQAGAEAGFFLDQLMDVELARVQASGFADAAVIIAGETTTTTRIRDSYFDGNRGTGLRAGNAANLMVENSVFESNGDYGMKLGTGKDCHPAVVLVDNHFEYNTNGAIRAGDAAGRCRPAAPSYTSLTSVGNRYIGRNARGNVAFDLGNARLVSLGDYIVTFPTVFRVNRGGAYTREVIVVGDVQGPGAEGPKQRAWGLGDEVVQYVENEGSTNPFVQIGTAGVRVVDLDLDASSTVTPNPRQATVFKGVLTKDVTIAAPVLAPNRPTLRPAVGTILEFMFTQDGAGGRAVRWNPVFKTSWTDRGNGAGKRASVKFIWDGSAWIQQSIMPWW